MTTQTTNTTPRKKRQSREDIVNEYYDTETKRYGEVANRPPAEDRYIGREHRRHYLRILRNAASYTFGMLHFFSANEAWKNDRSDQAKAKTGMPWSTLQVRPEVVIVLKMLQARHIENTDKEISQSEALNALMAVGLSTLIKDNKAFK